MRRLILLWFLALALSAPAAALELGFDGTLSLSVFPRIPVTFVVSHTGVAEVATASGVTRIDFPGGVFQTTGAIIPVTDPVVYPINGVLATFGNETGVFERSASGLGGSMPLQGAAKVCLFSPCSTPVANVVVPLSVVGVPRSVAATAAVNLTVQGAPWTTGVVSIGRPSTGGLRVSGSDQGSQLNLVTPIVVSTSIAASEIVPAYARLVLVLGSQTADHCKNGIDDDGDGFVDFPDDPGCDSPDDPSERNPGAPCDDGLDNDGDRRIDHNDPGCEGPLDGSERSATIACDDGFDNDGDGGIDFPEDRGCANPGDLSEKGTIACDDGLDNDGDGLVDLLDPGCADATDTSERGPGLVCDDGLDNDGDHVADFPADPGCASIEDPSETTAVLVCDNGLDDDGDGLADVASDPGCADPTDPSEHSLLLACDDGLDNDFDGTRDYPGDPGCDSAADSSELSPSLACDNGLDDDGDGLIDSQEDPGCTGPDDSRESFDFADGEAHTIDLAAPSPDAGVTVSSNDGPYGWHTPTSLWLGAGGLVTGNLGIEDDSYAVLTSGSIGGDLVVSDLARVLIRGGVIDGLLDVKDGARIEIFGTSFDLPFGNVPFASGFITGFLLDGTAVSIPYSRAQGATIQLVPEPASLSAAIAAFAALFAVRLAKHVARG